MPVYTNVSTVWKDSLPWRKCSGDWNIPKSLYIKNTGNWKKVFSRIPATCLVTMKTATVPSPGTLYNVNGYWAYSETATPNAQGPGSNSINWYDFGSYSGTTGSRAHSLNVDKRTVGSNGWYITQSSHTHTQSHRHPSSTSSRYPARLDLRQYYNCSFIPTGAVVFSRGAISHPCLTLASTSYNYYYVRIITGTPGGLVGAVTASKSFGLYTYTCSQSLVQDSYLRSVYFYSAHAHSMSHAHTVSPNPRFRYYRMYDVTAPIYDFDSLPSGSMMMAYSTTGWPAGWSGYSSGYLLRIYSGTTTHANGGATTQTITKSAFTSGARYSGTSREYQTGSEQYSLSSSTHTINAHTHPTAVTAYPQTRKVLFMEKA